MNTKNIFKALALAMLMPAMLLTTACSNDDDAVNNENTAKNGYTLPVTINVSRQDDGTTRATYTDNNDGTGTFAFGAGDKLFVWGTHSTAGQFAGSLTWTSGGTFSGTITTEHKWTDSADALFTQATSKHATLLPAGYETPGFISITGTGYSAQPNYDYTKAFALTKGAAVEQFSLEDTDGYTGSGFVLSPTNAILNFSITGLAASTEVAVVFTNTTPNPDDVISKNVTTDGSGNAKFAIAIHQTSPSSHDPGVLTLTVGGNAITINSTSKEFVAGHIYNITRSAAIPGALSGKFSVSATKQVYFSKGNLQATYNGTNWTWAFAANQWDYIGNAAGNTSINGNGTVNASNVTVDLFGWVGASSTWTGAAQYGISNSGATNNTNGYGNNASEALKSDWGNTIGSGWRTLTSAEWTYLFNTRTVNGGQGSGKSYTLGQSVNGKLGVVIYPDDYTGSVYAGSDWSTFEAAGCVFLPAAGYWHRYQAKVSNAGITGYYWSSSPNTSYVTNAIYVHFSSGSLISPISDSRFNRGSVRLVRDVE